MFSKEYTGISISDRTIEVVSIEKQGDGFLVKKKIGVDLKSGIIENGIVINEDGFVEIIKKIASDLGKKLNQEIVLGIPENFVYYHTIKVGGDGVNPANQIKGVIEKMIPLDKDSVDFSYKKIGKDNYLIVAWDKSAVLKFEDLFSKAGLAFKKINLETLAVIKALSIKATSEMVIDIGSVNTIITYIHEGGLVYSETIPLGGKDITDEIAKSKEIDFEVAEKLKKDTGLNEKESQIYFAITEILKKITDRISATLGYVKSDLGIDISEAVLVGGGSLLSGIDKYIEANIGIKVTHYEGDILSKDDDRRFLQAYGLAKLGIVEDDDLKFRIQDKKAVKKVDKEEDKSPSNQDDGNKQKIEYFVLLILLIIIIIFAVYIFA